MDVGPNQHAINNDNDGGNTKMCIQLLIIHRNYKFDDKTMIMNVHLIQ